MTTDPRKWVVGAAVLLSLATSACGSGDDFISGEGAPLPSDAFRVAVEARDLDGIAASFAPDIEIHTPVLEDPIRGHARVSALFGILADVFEDFRFTDEFNAHGDVALVFAARIGAQPFQGVDVLHFDEQGRIVTFTVMVRPLPGMLAIAEAVGPRLGELPPE